jgi:hypothetical protein
MDQAALENRLQKLAGEMPYPPTPDIVPLVRPHLRKGIRSRLPLRLAAGAALTIVLLAAALFAVPNVRAEIVRFIQIGVVRIFTAAPDDTPVPTRPAAPYTATVSPTQVDAPTPVQRLSSLDPAGATSLEAARQEAGFPVHLPAYPPDLGPPDKVYFQEDGPTVILTWLDPQQPERMGLSLYQIGPGSILVKKMQPEVKEVQVNDQFAAWTDGPYLLEIVSGGYREMRLVEGHTLVWTDGEITYRLETDLPLEEATRIAESLE